MTDQPNPPKTTAQRQAALRKRRADQGLTEVRNLFAKPEDHAKIKVFANFLQQKEPTPKK